MVIEMNQSHPEMGQRSQRRMISLWMGPHFTSWRWLRFSRFWLMHTRYWNDYLLIRHMKDLLIVCQSQFTLQHVSFNMLKVSHICLDHGWYSFISYKSGVELATVGSLLLCSLYLLLSYRWLFDILISKLNFDCVVSMMQNEKLSLYRFFTIFWLLFKSSD